MKQILYFILSIVLAAPLQAQGVRDAFINMPDSILPVLTKVNRADCIDFLDCDMKAVVKNRFDQESEMTRLTDDYIAMQLSSNHLFEMKMLPVKDSTYIICSVQTVGDKVRDSRVYFYTAEWEPLDGKDFITLPTQSDFQPKTVSQQVADTLSVPWESLCAEADILLMQASLSDSTPELTFRYTTPLYMSKESAARFIPLLKTETVSYDWKGKKFVRRP